MDGKPTGFLSLDSRGRSGYLLIFRELYEKPDFTMELPLPDDKFDWEIIYSSHESHIENQTHGVRVSIGKKLGFVWSRFIRELSRMSQEENLKKNLNNPISHGVAAWVNPL
jgi:hypothetical protein